MSQHSPATPSLLAAGLDSAQARKAFDVIAQLPAGEPSRRQPRVNDLCAWLRLIWGPSQMSRPADTDLGLLAGEVARFLVARLADPAAEDTFCGLDLDLSRTVIRELSFVGVHFTGGTADFTGCVFYQKTSFTAARFSAGQVRFDGSTFHQAEMAESQAFALSVFDGAAVSFAAAEFRNGYANFDDTRFTGGEVSFRGLRLTDSFLSFTRAEIAGAVVTFAGALFRSGRISFANCKVTGGQLSFEGAKIYVPLHLNATVIDGGRLSFDDAHVGGLSLSNVRLASGEVTLRRIFVQGTQNRFDGMTVAGGDFILDGARLLFGSLLLDRVSFLGGTVSLEGIVIEAEGLLDLPWGRYTAHRAVLKDGGFDGHRAHDFYTLTARYAPDVQIRWGAFQPRPE
jgi:uncharacterized protein YjbI with pentapeptide repeats